LVIEARILTGVRSALLSGGLNPAAERRKICSPSARFCLYVHHTDAAREWAYDRRSHIGKLDKGLDEAAAKGWTVVDMKNDWKTIFPPKR
jgi:hypothetical protein